MRASERKYRHLVDTTPAFIHTALPDGSLDFLSRGWLEYGGLPQTGLLDWRWTAAIHPEDVEGFVDKWRAALASGEPFEAESRVKRADGEYRWFLQRNVPLRDETGKIVKWYGTGIDIEERKTAEGKIREQEAELRQIVDLAPQHIGVFGRDGSPLYANRATLEYLGVGIDRWRDETARYSLVHPDDRERFLGERKRRFLEGVPHEIEVRLLGHDGKFRWFLFRLNPLKDERGQISRWYGTAIDIDDRRQAEDRLRSENVALREEIDKASMFEEIVGTSAALKSVLSRITKVAPSDSTVLITGETGTGKELVARAIHRRSNRGSRAFVSVNCSAIPRDLIASELFGHEKGAFTGATQQRSGRFELANGGTLFLDEVGELPAETQVALLRVLQEHEFERVGGTRPLRADVRVIAATNRDLQAAISAGLFRSDLFYRLNVFPIEIPPLRERRGDISLLVAYFIDRYARKAGKSITSVDKKTLDCFSRTLGPEIYANCRTSSSDLSSCAKPTIFQSMRVGCLKSRPSAKRKPAGSLEEGGSSRKGNHRGGAARMPRTGVRTVGSSCQTGDRAIHTGIEDSVTKNQQESLQDLPKLQTFTIEETRALASTTHAQKKACRLRIVAKFVNWRKSGFDIALNSSFQQLTIGP